MPPQTAETNDAFAQIAAQQVTYRDSNLIEPQPETLPDRHLPIGAPLRIHDFSPVPRIADVEALQSELERARERYAPFMRRLAPPLPSTRIATPIQAMDWRIQTEADKRDFTRVLSGAGDWEEVTIPHFGPPLGKATTYYRTTIQITKEQLQLGAAYLCFKAVDYKAHVFLNGTYLGSHEGFFAPFAFECSDHAHEGENTLIVRVENDYIFHGNTAWGEDLRGDKIYAATSLGYDEPVIGWHHCPPGMGIHQDLTLEFRARRSICDVYARPLPDDDRAEIRFEVDQCDTEQEEVEFLISVYGRNFEATVVANQRFIPQVIHDCGVGDDLQIALAKAAGIYHQETPLKVGTGKNLFIVSVEMKGFRWWSPDAPWLYQVQVQMVNKQGEVIDAAESHFGMRTFRMDENSIPKGALYLNGIPIRLRGANTMGHEQQCVFRKDLDQLRDDLLLAKIANMNFLRITQRPVQPEVYDYCDMLGLMTQNDLPTFAVIRRPKVLECLKQVEEVERLIRPHPCAIILSYINEPVNKSGNEPHRNISREEMEQFFGMADTIVRNLNPERVIKACDGDYDPPSPGIQDRHCYCTWYNGQGLDIGRLHKGFWQPTKKGWYHGCGEFGAEALENVSLMRRAYPAGWLPLAGENEMDWSPTRIPSAQSGKFHYFFYETPESLEEWVQQSQQYQASAMRMMAEAFRRDNRMVTFAIHLFIDAFPSGWMKSIMDCERRPKQAYFAYRDTLAPLLPNLRSDRSRFYAGEEISLEAWVCNDRPENLDGVELRYHFEHEGKIVSNGRSAAEIASLKATFQGFLSIQAPEVTTRSVVTARLALVDRDGHTLNDTEIHLEVFPAAHELIGVKVNILDPDDGPASRLAAELGIGRADEAKVTLASDFDQIDEKVLSIVAAGGRLVLLDPPPGTFSLAGHEVTVKPSGFNPLHFASRKTGHPLVDGFAPHDFRYWHDPLTGCISPIVNNTVAAKGAIDVLLSGNINAAGQWDRASAAVELRHGQGSIVIATVELAGRIATNPPARMFAERLIAL